MQKTPDFARLCPLSVDRKNKLNKGAKKGKVCMCVCERVGMFCVPGHFIPS